MTPELPQRPSSKDTPRPTLRKTPLRYGLRGIESIPAILGGTKIKLRELQLRSQSGRSGEITWSFGLAPSQRRSKSIKSFSPECVSILNGCAEHTRRRRACRNCANDTVSPHHRQPVLPRCEELHSLVSSPSTLMAYR